jgi:hypothetical protein|tara:strand:- start:269 stop:397 length:129 start_codon:yes stop_codon:yes gene_type:complete
MDSNSSENDYMAKIQRDLSKSKSEEKLGKNGEPNQPSGTSGG